MASEVGLGSSLVGVKVAPAVSVAPAVVATVSKVGRTVDEILRTRLDAVATFKKENGSLSKADQRAQFRELLKKNPTLIKQDEVGSLGISIGIKAAELIQMRKYHDSLERPSVMDRDNLTAADLLELDAPVSYAALQAKRKKEQNS